MASVSANDEIASGGNGAFQYPVIVGVGLDNIDGPRRTDAICVTANIRLHLKQCLGVPLEFLTQYTQRFI